MCVCLCMGVCVRGSNVFFQKNSTHCGKDITGGNFPSNYFKLFLYVNFFFLQKIACSHTDFL